MSRIWHPPVPSRRRFLRGMLQGSAVFVGLPLFERMLNGNGNALACGGAIPKRFGLYYWGNGNRPDRWVPTTTGTDYVLSEEGQNYLVQYEYLPAHPKVQPLPQLQKIIPRLNNLNEIVYTPQDTDEVAEELSNIFSNISR